MGKRIIIAGGGTGGHIFPAIAIANALKEIDASTQILFVGAMGKMEMEKVPQAGYEIRGLDIAGFSEHGRDEFHFYVPRNRYYPKCCAQCGAIRRAKGNIACMNRLIEYS